MGQPLSNRPMIVALAAAAAATAGASPVDVPNEFVAGTPAVASEVNENFAAIESAVNDNDARITAAENAITALQGSSSTSVVAVDATGAEIGLLVNVDDGTYALDVLTALGYVARSVSVVDGQVGAFPQPLWYQSTNCSGTPHVQAPLAYVVHAYDATGTPALFYVNSTAVMVANFAIQSVSDASGCQPIGGTLPFASPVQPNDSSVTGVPNQPYQAPVRIGRR